MHSDDVWLNLVNAFKTNDKNFPFLVSQFKSSNPWWMEFLKEKLFSNERLIAFSILSSLKEDELLTLFDILVYYASYTHGSTKFFRDIILRLPKEWVKKNIENFTDPIIEGGTEDEYRRILELFFSLDSGLTNKLARQAKESDNLAIREIGDEFLNLLTN